MFEISPHHSLLAHNTFGMEVAAQVFAEYDTPEDLTQVLRHPDVAGLPLLHIGAGSNLLFTRDFAGAVLHSRIGGIAILREAPTANGAEGADEVTVRVGSGVVWDDFCAWTVEQGLRGVENLAGIPGECGAAAVQNIGAYGTEIADCITEVETVEVSTGQRRTFSHEECRYGYRSSFFKEQEQWGHWAVTYVDLRLARHGQANLSYRQLQEALGGRVDATPSEVREAVLALRNGKLPDPKEVGNAGSFFKNPIVPRAKAEELQAVYPFMPTHPVDAKRVKIPAGWLIEQCGWKGRTVGRAGVYEKQSLVLVNRGGAGPQEIVELSKSIVRTVQDRFGITIEPEVNII
jgi:UDP-N-acetylmuramate dehydrogenase